MLTYFLAAVLGWYFVIMSMLLIFRHDVITSAMREIMEQRGVQLIIGVITLILGLLMVLSHNFWMMGWPVLITIFSWLVLIGGLVRIFFPDFAYKTWGTMAGKPHLFTATGIIILIIGLFLLFHVYYA